MIYYQISVAKLYNHSIQQGLRASFFQYYTLQLHKKTLTGHC